MSECRGPLSGRGPNAAAFPSGTIGAPKGFVFEHAKEVTMPARSKAQQKAAGAALSAKRGETSVSSLKGASKEMYDSMTQKELEELASTPRKGLPDTADGDD
jgi:hypothetical protein